VFGDVVDQEMRLNELGRIVQVEWEKTSVLRMAVELGAYVIMPNYFRAIVHLVDDSPAKEQIEFDGRGTACRAPTNANIEMFGRPVPGSIPPIVRSFKSAVTKRINEKQCSPKFPVWQRNY